jgi:penicillin-insensitive murein DD-endopeptidase
MRIMLGLFLMLAAPTAFARPLFRGVALPARGTGFVVPDTWRERGLNWGTPQLVGLIQRAAARVRAWDRWATVYVADLSRRNGGATEWHRSHRRGIDADLLYFARDDEDRQTPPPRAMQPFGEDDDTFDVERNWLLVKALLTDPAVDVTAIFMAGWIKERLLDYARDRGESPRLLARGEAILFQPSDSLAHDDHMHVRIAQPPPLRAEAREARDARSKRKPAPPRRR